MGKHGGKQKRMTVAEYRAQAMKAMSEDEFQSQVLECAAINGWRLIHHRPARTVDGWRTPMQGDPGFPDLVLARAGVVLFAELKREDGRLTPDQAKWLAEINGYGADNHSVLIRATMLEFGLDAVSATSSRVTAAMEWRPSDWPTIERILMSGK